MTRAKYTPIGLDIFNGQLNAVQFVNSGSYLRLHAAVRQTIESPDDPECVADAVWTLYMRGDFKGRNVACALPREQVDLRPLRIAGHLQPETPEFDEALRLEAGAALPYNADDAEYDYILLGEEIQDSDSMQSLLLVSTRLKNVYRHLNILNRAGLSCCHLEPAACASARTFSRLDGNVILIEIDHMSTNVSISNEGQLLFSRAFHKGERDIVNQISAHWKCTADEAWAYFQNFGFCNSVHKHNGQKRLNEIIGHEICSIVNDAFSEIGTEINRSIDYFMRQRRGGGIAHAFLAGASLPSNLLEPLNKMLPISLKSSKVFELLHQNGLMKKIPFKNMYPIFDEDFCCEHFTSAGLALSGF